MFLMIYAILINLIGLYVMNADKKRAQRNEWRIKEQTLWTIAIIGGALGATIGMNLYRHKTKHASFRFGLPALVVVHLALLLIYM
ncbi:DUF1294 domain-containing protein [Priestia flexa]|uniref:DUF1294 domain-containing protein n=3 Tax=Priestia TaxID=2800373 RepID=A0A0V8JKT3_9BACI|nr:MULTISPECIES: DUF1294 domain-containing protein [Bacillaceae]AQX53536.1 hypothetical protein BC359_03990 [Priestia flexa]KSU87651.1 hypothetical protein AS180_12110 [Priestia veravalensis]KZB92860.1 hypothetical protein A2U94_03825 [Bacillus sp. VT 712]MBY6085369.1 DUF1294 domain-containing protein [Priestia flexa]MCA1200898.1 DUF1294 domain-containing protein [Priestia flexa]